MNIRKNRRTCFICFLKNKTTQLTTIFQDRGYIESENSIKSFFEKYCCYSNVTKKITNFSKVKVGFEEDKWLENTSFIEISVSSKCFP